MNILFVNEKCGYFGGVEQNIADSVVGLRGRGHTCLMAFGTQTEKGSSEYRELFDGSFHCLELAEHSSQDAQGLLEIIERNSPDVIYFHKTGNLSFTQWSAGIRTVRMVHDHDLCCPRRHKYFAWSGKVCHHPAGWRCWLDGAFLSRSPDSSTGLGYLSIRKALRRMKENQCLDSLLVGSRAMREELVMNGFPEQNVHILAPVVQLTPGESCSVPEMPNILYVGQLIRGKGVDLLLRSLKQLDCDFNATIIGVGNATTKLKKLSRQLKLDKKVRFLGWVSHDELSKYYSWSKIVAVPSRWPEPFGMIGLEAMLHGRPVIAFEVGGIPDWLEHEKSGLLVPEQDTRAFAEALRRLLSDTKLAAEYGENGRLSVARHFGFEDYLDRLEAHLQGKSGLGQKTGITTHENRNYDFRNR